MACVYIPVQNSEEEVRVALDQLPRDASDILDILKAEQAPLDLWLIIAVRDLCCLFCYWIFVFVFVNLLVLYVFTSVFMSISEHPLMNLPVIGDKSSFTNLIKI